VTFVDYIAVNILFDIDYLSFSIVSAAAQTVAPEVDFGSSAR